MDNVRYLIEEYYKMMNGELVIGEALITDIVDDFGTPVYIYDSAVMKNKLQRLQMALPDFQIIYSVKANPNPALLQFFRKQHCGLNVATAGELLLAIKSGCPSSRIILAGSGKMDKDLEAGVEAGVSEIHVESIEEIRLLSAITKRRGQHMQVSLRFNPGEVSKNGNVLIAEKPAAYGFDEYMLELATDEVARSESLTLCGIHVYFGTQILDIEILLGAYEHTLNLASKLANYAGCKLKTIDFSGGFGVPYYANQKEFPMDEFGRRLQPIISDARTREELSNARMIVEPGRYLVAEGGLYVTRVIGKKMSFDKRFIIVDGGVHHHLAATGNLGHVIKRNFPLAIANRLIEENSQSANVSGRQCSNLDTLARNVKIPETHIGDIVVFFQSGAYARSASPLGFRSHPEPMEVFVEQGVPRIIRQKGGDDDFFRGTTLYKASTLVED